MFSSQTRSPRILGVLNVTPDSFSDGSEEALAVDRALMRAAELVGEGADGLDLGGESTRPGATPIDTETERRRVLPVLRAVRARFPSLPLSVDTRNPVVAEEALQAGATALNIHGGLDDRLATVLQTHRCPVIAYHTEEGVANSHEALLRRVEAFFQDQERRAASLQIPLILDPGIGWKTVPETVFLLDHLDALQNGKRTLLVGVSRKRHLAVLLRQVLSLPALPGVHERMEAGLAEAAIAIVRGASVIRTHDVASAKRFFAIFNLFERRSS